MLSQEQKRLCMSVPELATQMGISKPTAYALANRADFPSIRFGKRVIIPREAFEAWLRNMVSDGHAEIAIEGKAAR